MNHELLMRRCLDLAQNAKGFTSPNPMVGAIIVHEGRIIGEGWHHYYGGDHAEIDCLKNVKEFDKLLIPESTLYVSLEPCTHYGLTPPCAYRILEEGIKEIYIAQRDPFEKVNGAGIAILKNGGVIVHLGVLEQEAKWVNRRFSCFHSEKRPYIILKWAQTKDGYIAPKNSIRHQITNDASILLNHKWRSEESAIMVGTTTTLVDNPQLTSRIWEGKQPVRIIIDKKLIIPKEYHVFNNQAETWVLNEILNEQIGNIKFLKIDFSPSFLNELLSLLYEKKILSIIIEGGAQLLNSFIQAEKWDEARVFIGRNVLGAGITAPLMINANHEKTITLETDELNIFIHQKSKYQFITNLPL